jgi:predicted transcriptional regulator
MTELLEMAVAEIRKLPPEKQDQAARAIFDVVHGAEEDVYVLSEEEEAAIDVALEQVERGEYATEEDVAAIFAKYRDK